MNLIKTSRLVGLTINLIAILAAVNAAAATGTTKTGVERAQKMPIGVYASLGNPFPTLLGVNAAYNFNENIRATLGYGEVEVTTGLTFSDEGVSTSTVSATTYAAGANYLFFDSSVRGIAGLNLGYFQVAGDGEISINGFSKSTGYAYSNLGVDWIGENGLNIGAGMNLAVVGASGSSFYINSGWFF